MDGAFPAFDFVSRIETVLGHSAHPIALHEPEFSGNEWSYVKECLDTGWVSSVGKYVDEFEFRLASYTGAKYAVAVVNGTAGLHIALQVAGVEPGDEVFVPALTFVATANAVSHCGAVPHFVDSTEANFGLDPLALGEYLAHVAELAADGFRNRLTGRRLAAIVPMHAFGHPVDMEALLDVAARYKLAVVEDAAESLGSWIGSRHTGTFGQMGVLSFNGNKIITTGGGGAILTDDREVALRLKHLTTTAKLSHRWEFVHDEVAYNYRLPNLNAALGCAQLERLPTMLLKKRQLAEAYADAFADVKEFRFAGERPGRTNNYWLNVVQLADGGIEQRDALLQAAANANYQCRPVWRLLNRLSMYEKCPRAELPVAQHLEQSLINLPSSSALAARLAHADI
jgi:perosamine synthetase